MILRRADFSSHGINVHPDLTDSKEEVCVDLHVGDSFMEAGSSSSYPFDKPYLLEPGACIIVRTKEVISLPKDAFGTLCAKGKLAALGFLVPNTKVDPLFADGLDIALFNAGKRPLHVNQGMAFCSVIFHTLRGPVSRTTPRNGIRVIEVAQQKKRTTLEKIGKHFDQWKNVYGLIAAILALALSLLKVSGILP